MGTNYYLHAPSCPHCGHEMEESVHLGKSSWGWCFGLHIYPENGINNWEDLTNFIWFKTENDGWKIKDEYGMIIAYEEFLEIVCQRQGKNACKEQWLAINHAVKGPFGLARHQIDDWHCIGHGEGTYDYLIGDFS